MTDKEMLEWAADMTQAELLSPAEELAIAKAHPEGMYLSPAAQALYEQEGAQRFAKHHPQLARAAAEIGRSMDSGSKA